ncbi:MAG: molybdenum cofactor cytidylyltransferase [Solirubrobacterales bacterium]
MICAIIMASGSSKRMGKNKLLLPFLGKSLIENIIDIILESKFSKIVLVAASEEIIEIGQNKNIVSLYNKNAEYGQSESIKIGLGTSPDFDGYMFFTGDQPLLDGDTIRTLINAFENNKNKIIIPSFEGKSGNPVIFPVKFYNELMNLSGDVGGRIIINKYNDEVLKVEVNNKYVLFDVDTPEEYSKIIDLQKDEFK